jgi:hypothetical protein
MVNAAHFFDAIGHRQIRRGESNDDQPRCADNPAKHVIASAEERMQMIPSRASVQKIVAGIMIDVHSLEKMFLSHAV